MVGMKIQSVVGINGHTLLVYCCANTSYRFSVVDLTGKSYTCDTSFPSADSAKFMGVAAIEHVMESEGDYKQE